MFYVLKRNGQKEDIHFDKITYRIVKLINPIELQFKSCNNSFVEKITLLSTELIDNS